MIENIKSYEDLDSRLKEESKTYLLFYKSGSEKSDCALAEFTKASEGIETIRMLGVNVGEVKDVHEKYNVNTAPTMLEFDGKVPKNMVKGCHDSRYFRAILEDAVYSSSQAGEAKAHKRVVVYTTPTCTWCNTLKSYLRENKVRFREIDVSRDQKAADEMVNRSGQQGVPQTDINGQMIVGFDKARINNLLDLK